jgi:hypothetical protein
MWSLYVPAANFFLLKQDARFCEGCAGKIKGSLPHTKEVPDIFKDMKDGTGSCKCVWYNSKRGLKPP